MFRMHPRRLRRDCLRHMEQIASEMPASWPSPHRLMARIASSPDDQAWQAQRLRP
jgi:hypothetical protein